MMTLKLLATSFLTILIGDLIWLGWLAKPFYIKQFSEIGRIEDGKFNIILWPAFLVYILLSLAIVYYALPSLPSESGFLKTFLVGALLGLIIYGVYDLTNYATLKNFPLAVIAADMVWGAFICGLGTLLTKWVQDL